MQNHFKLATSQTAEHADKFAANIINWTDICQVSRNLMTDNVLVSADNR